MPGSVLSVWQLIRLIRLPSSEGLVSVSALASLGADLFLAWLWRKGSLPNQMSEHRRLFLIRDGRVDSKEEGKVDHLAHFPSQFPSFLILSELLPLRRSSGPATSLQQTCYPDHHLFPSSFDPPPFYIEKFDSAFAKAGV